MFDWILKQTSKLSQKGAYQFYVKHTPQIIDSSSTLSVTVFAHQKSQVTIPCSYRWSRIKNGIISPASQFKGSSFYCQPSDVGSIIQVQIISNDADHSGTAILQYGPVKLDIVLKKQVQGALASRQYKMFAYIVQESIQIQCQIHIFQSMIKLIQNRTTQSYNFQYSISQPRFETGRDPSKLSMVFHEKYENEARKFVKSLFGADYMTNSVKLEPGQVRLDIRFVNRSYRDCFLFIIKAFITKRQLKNSVVINKIQKIDLNTEQSFNYVLQIQSLRTDLVRLYQQNRKISLEKQLYQQQIGKLQRQIQQIVVTYTKIVENKCKNQADFNSSYLNLTNKKDEVFQKKCKKLEEENYKLMQRIKIMTQQIDKIRFSNPTLQMKPIQSLKHIQSLNYSNAFKKKHDEFENFLEGLNESEIGRDRARQRDLIHQLETIAQQKKILEKRLEKSFQHIDLLQRQAHDKSFSKQNPQNATAIQFTYGANNNNPLGTSYIMDNKNNFSMVSDYDKVKKDYETLVMSHKNLQIQHSKLKQDFTILNQQSKQTRKLKLQSQILKMQMDKKSEKSNTNTLKKEVQSLKHQNKYLQEKIALITKERDQFKIKLQLLNSQKNVIQIKSKKKIAEMNEQLEMLRRNQDTLNRSQHISMQMENYNEQQLTMLKQHNQFLTSQNQKLAKACEKYMADAKQSTKLRQQIISLKQQLNALRTLQQQSMSIS